MKKTKAEKRAERKASRAVVPFSPRAVENAPLRDDISARHVTATEAAMALTNAERQARYREKQHERFAELEAQHQEIIPAAVIGRVQERTALPVNSEEEILGAFTIPVLWNVRIIGAALATIGIIILVFIALSLLDLIGGFHVITGKKGTVAVGWSLAFDIFYIALETLIIFAPRPMVSRLAAPAKFLIALLSMGCNSFAFYVDAADEHWPVASAFLGAFIPVIMVTGTEIIGHAVAAGRKQR